jgi:hypothetical protein
MTLKSIAPLSADTLVGLPAMAACPNPANPPESAISPPLLHHGKGHDPALP